MSKHTPGPWTARAHWAMPDLLAGIYAEADPRHALFGVCAAGPPPPGANYDAERTNANAQRVVDCVNPCEGIDDPAKAIAKAVNVLLLIDSHEDLVHVDPSLVVEALRALGAA